KEHSKNVAEEDQVTHGFASDHVGKQQACPDSQEKEERAEETHNNLEDHRQRNQPLFRSADEGGQNHQRDSNQDGTDARAQAAAPAFANSKRVQDVGGQGREEVGETAISVLKPGPELGGYRPRLAHLHARLADVPNDVVINRAAIS